VSQPLRFCFVTTFYPPYHFGGDAISVYRLAEALAREGHAVDVVHSVDAYRLSHPDEPEQSYSHHANVTLHPLRSKRYRLAALAVQQLGRPAAYGRKLRAILAAGNYDVIHYHNISLVGGPGVLRLGNAVKLYTTHEYWLVCPTHVLFAFEKEACTERKCFRCTLHYRRPPQLWRMTGLLDKCMRHVDSLIMLSKFAMERHRADGIDSPMVHIANFVPEPKLSADAASPEPEPYFLYVGRLEKLKGVQDLIRLFANYREAPLLIAGDGSYRAELEAAARGLDHVKFLGRVHPDAIGDYYANAIAVLVPSLCYEVFCLIPQEAFACGTPVIVRRIGALTEAVEDTGGGLSFETLDECKEAMERLRTQPDLRSELSAKARAAYREKWTQAAHQKQYMALVRKLIANR
jgi:glycosyltransferase involved in cell wall biosynthesis